MKILILAAIFSCQLWAQSSAKKDRVNEQVDMKKCSSYVASMCSSKEYVSCLKGLTKDQVFKVNKCVSYMKKNDAKEEDVAKLDTSFQEMIMATQKTKSENQKCYEISKRVCGDTEFEKCIVQKAGSFPSYCKQAAFEGIDKLKNLYQNDRKVAMCADILAAKCEFNIPKAKAKPDPAKYKKALSSYKSCVQKRMKSVKECNDFSKESKEQATQLLR